MKGPFICRLCPRQCGVNRTAGELGRCRAGGVLRIFRWGAHHGEEPPISGTKGSGTVFFSHCPLGCIYCQNHPWTSGGAGEDISTERLAAILRSLAGIGCHNWNLVTPEPWLPWIREAAELAWADGIRLPFVYNTSAYVRPSTAQEYRTLQDICLCRSPICFRRVCEGGVICGGLSGRCPRLHSMVSRSGWAA